MIVRFTSIGDDRRIGPNKLSDIYLQRIAFDDRQPAWIMRRDLFKRGQTTRIALNGDDSRALLEQRARQPAGTWTDFDDDRVVEGPGGAGDARSEIEIEQKVLSKRFSCIESIAGDDVSQRRQRVDHLRYASCEFDRLDQTCRIGDAFAGDVKGRSMIGRRAHEGKAERNIDAAIKGERLDWNQRLIMRRAQRHVIFGAGGFMEHRVGGKGSRRIDAARAQFGDRRRDSVDLLAAKRALFARMGIEACKSEARLADVKTRAQIMRHDLSRLDDQFARQAF